MHQDNDCVVTDEDLKEAIIGRELPPAPSPTKTGSVERLKGDPDAAARYPTIIAEGFFNAEEDQRKLVGCKVTAQNGDLGTFAVLSSVLKFFR